MVVTIVGGGIVGLSTALLLETSGHETRVLTEHLPYADPTTPRSVAAEYAAASVKPRTVGQEYPAGTFRDSHAVFAALHDTSDTVEQYPNFEVYERPDVPDPSYADVVDGYRRLDLSAPDAEDPPVPLPGDAPETLSGYRYDVYFVHMPDYFSRLRCAYEARGRIERRRVTDLGEVAGDVVVNCTGYGARSLCEDDAMVARRGHLLYVDTDERPRTPDGDVFSYTYTRDADSFVYSYPRRDALVLGGSNQPGTPTPGTDEWDGDPVADPIEVDGVRLPRRIRALNRDILGGYAGVDIDGYRQRAVAGYRPFRTAGLRLEREGRLVHNYGHGGAGLTLSWGSAERARRLVAEETGRAVDRPLPERVAAVL
jgi:D-amino-acid oxidase